jgi:hypothetical protein
VKQPSRKPRRAAQTSAYVHETWFGLVNLKFCFGIGGYPASGWRVAVPAHRESLWSFDGWGFSGAGSGLYVYECVGLESQDSVLFCNCVAAIDCLL